MSTKYSVNDLIYRANKRRSDSGESVKARDYSEILDKLQRLIAKNHSAELAQVLYSQEAEGRLKDLIMHYLNSEQLVAKDLRNISELVDAVYYDMAGMGWYYVKKKYKLNVNFSINSLHCLFPSIPMHLIYPNTLLHIR